MGSNERIPNRDIDEYLSPPLHPDYDPKEITKKLEAKRARMRESMKAFSRHQAEAAARRAAEIEQETERKRQSQAAEEAKRNKQLDYRDNLSGFGFLTHKVKEPVHVRHTAENNQFFRFNPETDRFELRYHGSGDIVNFLEYQVEGKHEGDKPVLSLFDTDGIFYDSVYLLGVQKISSNNGGRDKHTAIFAVPVGDIYEELFVAVDDIYCIAETNALVI